MQTVAAIKGYVRSEIEEALVRAGVAGYPQELETQRLVITRLVKLMAEISSIFCYIQTSGGSARTNVIELGTMTMSTIDAMMAELELMPEIAPLMEGYREHRASVTPQINMTLDDQGEPSWEVPGAYDLEDTPDDIDIFFDGED